MNDQTHAKGPQALDFKSATLYAVRVVLRSADTAEQLAALAQRMKDAGSFFEDEPVVIDASAIDAPVDWTALVDALRQHKLHPVGIIAHPGHADNAIDSGLPHVELSNPPARPQAQAAPDKEVPVLSQTAQQQVSATPTPPPAQAPAALLINRQLRSGQRIYARHTDLIVIGAVSQGAEVVADGNIHVYGPLRGKAMAGARGDTKARIFTTELDPELIAIAGVYRIIETRLDAQLRNKPAVVTLEDDTLRFDPLSP
ncbi:septum site-determining protein MinC [Alcaligenes aquatilis]|uniref:Probable septum site-determining protein MinC n=1 Tax=Alcaligenes aquatilis TaxID=323284 RepID=A0A3G2HS89_9BURK|nr:septum site-determining protein MinC [Alcaligenes aquatilis]AYN19879.1 septum site-determining protein MinC [Alcaligenes aquatilis]